MFTIPAVPFTPSVYAKAAPDERITVFIVHDAESRAAAQAAQQNAQKRYADAIAEIGVDPSALRASQLDGEALAAITRANNDSELEQIRVISRAVQRVVQGKHEEMPPSADADAQKFWRHFGARFITEVFLAVLTQQVDQDHRGK